MSNPIWHTRRTLVRGLAFIAGASALGACATTAAAPGASESVEYRLGPAAQLRVTRYNQPDLTGLFVGGAQGAIAYPLVGSIQAGGRSVDEFTAALRRALSVYMRQPNVSVEVANYRPFFILGEVQRPGTYPYQVDITVMNAVATAGGFTYRANRGRVYIRHASEPEEHAYNLTASTPVLPGDTIRIGER